MQISNVGGMARPGTPNIVHSGKLERVRSGIHLSNNRKQVFAQLTSDELKWGGPTRRLRLQDLVAVAYVRGADTFTVYGLRPRWGLQRRTPVDVQFWAGSESEAQRWVDAFAAQGCRTTAGSTPQGHPPTPVTANGRGSPPTIGSLDTSPAEQLPVAEVSAPGGEDAATGSACLGAAPKTKQLLVVVNPKAGHGQASKVMKEQVLPVLQKAGLGFRVVETQGPGHATRLAAGVDLSECADGIVCVGGDGLVNEVMNGLFLHSQRASALAVPIGIVPAGSDNSLCWSVLGIRDPSSAALAIVKGVTVPVDAFAVGFGSSDGSASPTRHIGACLAYYGFMSDVLGLSAKYQRQFGPLRYAVAGINRLASMASYEVEVEFVPAKPVEGSTGRGVEGGSLLNGGGRRSKEEEEAREVVPLLEEGWWGSPRGSRRPREKDDGAATSSCVLEEVPYSEGSEGKGGHERAENSASQGSMVKDAESLSQVQKESQRGESSSNGGAEEWQLRRGPFLSIMVANHGCRSVMNLPSQCLAPKAAPSDGALDLILVKPVGRIDVLRFLTLMQVGRHLELPFVKYIKAKEVRILPGPTALQACGVDGELLPLSGPATISVLPKAFQLLGQYRHS